MVAEVGPARPSKHCPVAWKFRVGKGWRPLGALDQAR